MILMPLRFCLMPLRRLFDADAFISPLCFTLMPLMRYYSFDAAVDDAFADERHARCHVYATPFRLEAG